jgi:predicted  nucleic acid-binding Zn-ribbon protein
MSRVFTLERLQAVDQELDEKTKRARQIDERLASDPLVLAGRADLEAEEKLHAQGRSTLRTREMEAKSVDLKIKEIEGRLYGGRVSNPKELQDMEKDLQMHKRQRSHLDDQLLELMEAVDQTQKRVNEKSAALKKMEGTRASDVEALSREREALTGRLGVLSADRDQLRASLDSDVLRTYDHLRRTKTGRAVSQIRNGACSACGVSVPTGLVQRVRAGSELVFCSGCGRILSG